jgi:hypothetical protein
MRKLMLAGVVAFAMTGWSGAFAGEAFVVTDGHIAQFKAVLNLTAAQERYWSPVEATLRDIARRQNAAVATLDYGSVRRIIASAMPLFRRLDSEQKRDAIALARSLGISSLASAF